MAYQFNNVSAIEPVSAADGILKGNATIYNVITGCDATYSASNMTVDCSAGSITFNGFTITVAGGASFWTLVSDSSNPRWTWLAIDENGDAVVVSGTAAATPSVPALGNRVAIALVRVEAGQTIADNITTKIDKRIPGPLSPYTYKYKTATQVFTTSTTFADITASSGTFSFTAEANGIYVARYSLPVTFGGTGGVKLQLTGPASPTLVRVDSLYPSADGTASGTQPNDSNGDQEGTVSVTGIPGYTQASATAFSTAFVNVNSSGGSIVNGLITLNAFIANGSTAGSVTLQGAQNSSNSTTTFAAGCWMVAQKVG